MLATYRSVHAGERDRALLYFTSPSPAAAISAFAAAMAWASLPGFGDDHREEFADIASQDRNAVGDSGSSARHLA
jgi:hypothetical protein